VANAEPAPELEARAVAVGRGETVLLVASDGTRLLRDEEMLAALGYEPVGFTTVAAALAACRAKPERFDVFIIGHLGSCTSSLELATVLHAAAPHAPIVMATRSMEGIGADNLIGAGISDVVRWPIVAEEIAAALAHRSAPRESLARRVPMLAAASSTR
jgi:DNA-binding NtrC family response regulator